MAVMEQIHQITRGNMIHIPAQAKIFAIPKPISFNESLDRIIAVCRENSFDPYSGEIFVFRDEDATQIGLLSYDGHGFQWCMKRFSDGNLAWWPSDSEVIQILPRELQIMMWGGNPSQIKLPEMWRPINQLKQESTKIE